MESSRELVVYAPVRHVLKGSDNELTQGRVSGGRSQLALLSRVSLDQQIEHGRMRKFGRRPEPTIARIEHLLRRIVNCGDDIGGDTAASPRKRFRLCDRVLDHRSLLDDVAEFLLVGIRNTE